MMLTIELSDMRFYARHGCFDEERRIGTHFTVDLSIEAPCAMAAVSSDRLEETLNYQSLYEMVKEEMEQPSRLLEHVAGRILKRIKADFPQTGVIKISISKLNPPLGGQVGAARVVLTL
jgi:dihydroneopterin aldolase